MAGAGIIILRCDCGQRSWIPNYDFNQPGCLEYGTPYRCSKCHKPLGSRHATFIPAFDAALAASKEPSK